MEEIFRLYYLAVELRPTLPNTKLMNILPRKYADLIYSGVRDGLGSMLAGYETLAASYMRGASSGVTASEREFKSLITALIHRELSSKTDIRLEDQIQLQGALASYYQSGTSIIKQKRVKFNTKSSPLAKFSSGFEPLDVVLGGALLKGVITLLGIPSMGKTYIAQAIANSWQHGSVWFCEPEVGEDLILDRQDNIAGFDLESKEYFFGHYSPEAMLDMVQEEPDENRLIVWDSLHVICGTGSTPESRNKYERAYETAIRLKAHCKLLIITTQVKRGNSGDEIDSGAASSCIERYSDAQINIRKELLLPDGCNQVRLFCSKNRMGPGGGLVNFAFNYEKGKFAYMMDGFSNNGFEALL